MSTRIAYDPEEKVAVLYDSVTGIAFGQVFEGEEAYESAERFVAWCPVEPRILLPEDLARFRTEFLDYLYDIQKPDTIPVREQT